MRHLLYAFLILCFVVALSACDSEVTEVPENPVPADTTRFDSTEIKADTDLHTVAEAYEIWSSGLGNSVRVVGYIVGNYVGTQGSSVQFSAPFGSESNLILADDSDATASSRLFAVSLKNGSEMRLVLNLKEHPELLHRRLVVQGEIETYFGNAGMRSVEQWTLLEPSVTPDTPVPAPVDTVATDSNAVPIDTAGEVINTGRLPLK